MMEQEGVVFITLNNATATTSGNGYEMAVLTAAAAVNSSSSSILFWYRYSSALASGALIAAYGLVFIAGLIGNVFVIIAVVRSGGHTSTMMTLSRHCNTNIFFANLAVADLLVIIACLPFTLISNLIYRKSIQVYSILRKYSFLTQSL